MYVSVVRQSTLEVCTAWPAAEALADSSVTGRWMTCYDGPLKGHKSQLWRNHQSFSEVMAKAQTELSQRTHNLTLPTGGNPVMKQNFVYRMVFKDIYWFLSNVQCYFTKTLLFRDIYSNLCVYSLYHVRLSCVIKGFTYLLTYSKSNTVGQEEICGLGRQCSWYFRGVPSELHCSRAGSGSQTGSRQQDCKVSGTWKDTHLFPSCHRDSGIISHWTGARNQETHHSQYSQTAENPPSCFGQSPWLFRGEMRSHS